MPPGRIDALVVDDERRLDKLIEQEQRCLVVTVKTSEQALSILSAPETIWVEELWLDHDLGGDDTTMPVVDWLCERKFNEQADKIGTVRIHTSNPVGRDNIASALLRWGIPFTHEDPKPYMRTPHAGRT